MNGRKQCDPINGCGKFYKSHLAECPACKTPEAFANFVPYNPLDWVYDEETYPNIFTADLKHPNTGTRLLFEISDRRNDINELYAFLMSLKAMGCRLVGFNNNGFDYPILHFIIEYYHTGITVTDIFNKAQSIIDTPWSNRFDNVIWDNDVHIVQIDLYKIHHFDNKSRRTSLKLLEFNMRMDSIEDLPYPPGTMLNDTQKDVLIGYNDHDVDATELFYFESLELIEFREQLSEKYDRNFLNHNDTKIGKDYFIMKLEEALPGSCYTYNHNNKRVPRQTIRQAINLADVVFPYINFKVPEFNRVKDWLASQIITNFDLEYLNIKGIFTDLCANVNGFKYDFGSGGIHGSIDSAIVCSDDDYILYDWDVASYYPNLAIVNRLYPEHLSEEFCNIYKDVFEQRRQHKKGTAENAMLKLALNGVYGDSNNKYSPFYDPQYTMSITINGQLLLCMLAQHLIDIPGLQMIQINTDGLTVRCPRNHVDAMKSICKWWEEYTQLELESAVYSRMFIRDVNNYIGEYEDGKLKRKGAYCLTTPREDPYTQEVLWHKDHSALIVPMAAEAALVHGQHIPDFIRNHVDINDFMLRTKINRSDKLLLNDSVQLQRITRYYISKQGGSLSKVSPPTKGYKVGQWKRSNSLTDQFYNAVRAELEGLSHNNPEYLDTTGLPWDERINTKNKSKYEIRKTNINAGYLVAPCNHIRDFNRDNINYDYYIAEAEKLVTPLRG